MKLADYPGYTFDGENVFTPQGKKLTCSKANNGHRKFKVKNKKGKWVNLGYLRMKALLGLGVKVPIDAVLMHRSNDTTYITPRGEIFTTNSSNPAGYKLNPFLDSNGYYRVTVFYDGKRRPKELHSLIVENFILKDYVAQGLCCLHKDDNKTNYALSNLSIGTYTKNNKDAYITGVNPGNGLKPR